MLTTDREPFAVNREPLFICKDNLTNLKREASAI